MRHIVIVIPEWVREDSSEDVLRQSLPALARMAEAGRLFKVSKAPTVECPEALVLGLGPGVAELRQGPLTISALGADPPERSVHFHLSLLEHRGGTVNCSQIEPTPEDLAKILEMVPKLNTKQLTFVRGVGRDHGLVWEGMGDLRTYTPEEVAGKPMRGLLPDGDGDPILRRYIDDSINLLSELELNERRAEEDLPLLNLLWPWGNGIRIPLPNLALKRGLPAFVVSESMRLQGLSRLVGYRHADRSSLRSGIQFELGRAAESIFSHDSSIVFLQAFAKLEGEEFLEEKSWFSRQIDERLLTPIFDTMNREPLSMTLIAPSTASLGLGLEVQSKENANASVPFDQRALEEKILPVQTLWEPIAANLAS